MSRRPKMDRKLSPPVAAMAPPAELPNSLQSNNPVVDRERPRSRNYAETKRRPLGSAGNAARKNSRLANNARPSYQPSISTNAAKRWVSGSAPESPAKRKRSLHPPGLPTLASPGTHVPSKSSRPQQHHHRDIGKSGVSQANDSPPSTASSGDSDFIYRTARKTARQCTDHASRRQAAAKAALDATSKISSSLTDLLGDSNRGVTLARQTRIEAENAAARAEGAAKKLKEARDLAAKDIQRASLELDEANAQAEDAWDFLRRVKGSKGRKKDVNHTKAHNQKIGSSRIETVPDECGDSFETDILSCREKAENNSSRPETKENTSLPSNKGYSQPQKNAPSPFKFPSQSDAPPIEESALVPIRQFKGHTSPVTQIAAVDQNRFISSSWDTTIRMWNADSGECIRTFRGHKDWVHAISVLDTERFLSGSDDRTVKLWNVDKEECIQTFRGHSSFVKALAPMDGNRFLSGSRDRTIKLFSVSSGECLQTFEGHMDVVSTIVALDSHHFASGSHDNNIKYWNDSSGKCLRTLVGHTGSIKTLAAVSGTEIVSGSDDKMIRLWDVSSGKCLREFGSKNSLVFSVTYICEGFFLSCGGNNIKLYHIPSGACVKSYETPRISLAVVRLDDERFITGSDQMLHLW
eukprot:CAMPEP_0183736334 /NCGR_PEP_ID=MMETSP0737-20130205/49035_1 /TAXON_ID=385413 /ORGANISM="Thalassiosira miniscula, Strain CCMP1093" /LENGTH=636 /DNA_ID=CAMNT_0025970301 /DNA_START=175 /DNA_END=2082 /DNA_ORIENTATION=-